MGAADVKQFLKNPDLTSAKRVFDRRKAKRLFLSFPIEVSGVDRCGQPFVERTKTQDVSDAGCRLFLIAPVERGDIVNIRLCSPPGVRLPEEKAEKFEIKSVEPTGTGFMVGARKIMDGDIWKISFPARKSSP